MTIYIPIGFFLFFLGLVLYGICRKSRFQQNNLANIGLILMSIIIIIPTKYDYKLILISLSIFILIIYIVGVVYKSYKSSKN